MLGKLSTRLCDVLVLKVSEEIRGLWNGPDSCYMENDCRNSIERLQDCRHSYLIPTWVSQPHGRISPRYAVLNAFTTLHLLAA